MNWSIFQSMFDGIEQPILDKVDGISDSLLGAVSGHCMLHWSSTLR
jgi:hypothetical protein